MKRIITALLAGVPALAFSGAAIPGHGFTDNARVIDAQPLYETVEVAHPVTRCWTERVTRNGRGHRNPAAPIAGGIVGGLLGHRLGKGHNRTALTVAGTLLGASLGQGYNRSHYRPRPAVEQVRRCRTTEQHVQEQKLAGYRVKYSYEGQTFYTRTREHPGERIPVRISVSPAGDGS